MKVISCTDKVSQMASRNGRNKHVTMNDQHEPRNGVKSVREVEKGNFACVLNQANRKNIWCDFSGQVFCDRMCQKSQNPNKIHTDGKGDISRRNRSLNAPVASRCSFK